MPSALDDKEAIREVLAEYCFRLDGGRYDEMAALFTADGTWDTAFGKATGHAAIAQLARDLRARAGDNRPRAIHWSAISQSPLRATRPLCAPTGSSCRTARKAPPAGRGSARAAPTPTGW
jgi:SnoaL-like domain